MIRICGVNSVASGVPIVMCGVVAVAISSPGGDPSGVRGPRGMSRGADVPGVRDWSAPVTALICLAYPAGILLGFLPFLVMSECCLARCQLYVTVECV